jgi:hypothetical protein
MLHDPRFLPPDGTVREVALALLAGWLAAVETHLPRVGAASEDGVVTGGVGTRS